MKGESVKEKNTDPSQLQKRERITTPKQSSREEKVELKGRKLKSYPLRKQISFKDNIKGRKNCNTLKPLIKLNILIRSGTLILTEQ